MQTKEWTVQIFIDEDGSNTTTARAVLTTRDTTTLTGVGRAHRLPIDPAVPEIGDQIAAGRALFDLAERLRFAASDDLAGLTGPIGKEH